MSWAIAIPVVTGLAALSALAVVWRQSHVLKRERQAARTRELRAQLMENLLAAVPVPVLVLDREGRYLEEFPPSPAGNGRTTLAELPPEIRTELPQRVRTAAAQGRREQLRFVHHDVWYVADVLPLAEPTETPAAAALVIRDVTAEHESANRLDKLATRNDAILRSAMDGFFIADDDYRFLEVNDAFCRMTGYSASELLRMMVTDLEVPAPEQARHMPRTRTGLHHFATAHRHKDGHVIQLENSVIVLRDEGRKILVGFARDVTERCRAEQALIESEERYRMLFEQSRDAIYVSTRDGRLEDVNQAALDLFGYAKPELIGRNVRDLYVSAVDRDRFQHEIEEKGSVQDYPVRLQRKDGTAMECLLTATIREAADARVLGYQGIIRDITERKRVEEERRKLETQVQHSQKLESLGMLAGGVAHDFNNFLVGILGNASLALEKLPLTDGDARPHLQKIIKVSQRASELTRQMLAYSGRANYDVRPTNLNELVNEMGEFMRAAVPKSVELVINLQEDLPAIEADSGQIQQVIMNLLINAAEAIGNRSGRVAVNTAHRTLDASKLAAFTADQTLAPGDYVCLEVSDTGCGMSPETLERIFDPFFTTKFAGRGLGLAALLGIARGHRGAVRVNSRLNHGTVFTVVFPATLHSAPAPPCPKPVGRLPADTTVLVIDDEEEIRDVVRSILEHRGVRVLLAEDGPRGLDLFRQHADQIDLVLLDMTMPGMSGTEVFGEIVTLRPSTRVILSSGYTEQEISTRFDDGKLAGFIQKPYTIDTLVEKVGQTLADC